MARTARKMSASGVYRVILRSDKMIFSSDGDAADFLAALSFEKENDFMEIYAYCLLNTQIHLVLKEGLSGISSNIMHISSRYASGFNLKHSAYGPIFKGRFVSYPLESGGEVLDATRFVHTLPLRTGLNLDYEFSSYAVYFKKSPLLSAEAVIALTGSIIDFKLFTEQGTQSKAGFILSDNELKKRIREVIKDYSAGELENLDKDSQAQILERIKKIEGAEPDAIARVLGLSAEEV